MRRDRKELSVSLLDFFLSDFLSIAHAGITVVTSGGPVKLNFENAPELKATINA